MDFKEFEKSIITKFNAIFFTKGRSRRKLDRIVIHHWGRKGQNFLNIVDWFCKWNNRHTSCHYVVGEGKIAQIVNDSDTSHHAGNWDWNCRSIGIECMPEKHQKDLHLVAQLVALLWHRYGKLPVYEHRQIVSTDCPGIWSAKEVTELAEKYFRGEVVKKSKSKAIKEFFSIQISKIKTKKEAEKIVRDLKNKGLNAYMVSKETGKGKVTSYSKNALVRKAQKSLGMRPDGLIGQITRKSYVSFLQKALNKTFKTKLTVDGVLGPRTKKAMSKHLLQYGDSNNYVTALQILLYLNKYDPKGIDGEFGNNCLKAVKKFQEDNNLEVDGIVGPKTFNMLTRI